MWMIIYAKQAQKDAKKISQCGLKDKVLNLLSLIEQDPLINPPPYEKLVGNLFGTYSRRINIQHRLVYEVLIDENTQEKFVKILRMWSHYE
jgi:toxin YoeB